MDFFNISDDELFMLYLEENEYAKEILFNRLKKVINSNIKEFQRLFILNGIDKTEVLSEALYAVTEALMNYRQGMKSTVSSFVNLCIKRRFYKYYRNKKSIDITFIEDVDNKSNLRDNQDLLNNLIVDEFINNIKQYLSKQEDEVFDLITNNYTYKEIANLLNKSTKQVDNAVQRIRKKIKNHYLLLDRCNFCLFI